MPAEIQRLLLKEGLPVPARSTIWAWAKGMDSSSETEHRHRQAVRRADKASFAWPGRRSVEWRRGRAHALAAAGLSAEQVVAVMRIDFPADPPNEQMVANWLAEASECMGEGCSRPRKPRVAPQGPAPSYCSRRCQDRNARIKRNAERGPVA